LKIGESVTVVNSRHQQIQIGQQGVVTDILHDGYGVQFIMDYNDATGRTLLKHRFTAFMKAEELQPLMTIKNGTTGPKT
jgi:hypothetical protein